MMKKIFALVGVLLLSITTSLAGPKDVDNSLVIKLQNGERWWGLVVEPSSVQQPFGSAFELDVATLSPALYKINVLLSNRGRYVYSPSPLKVAFDGKQLTLTTTEKGAVLPVVEKSGRTLRESYLMCFHKYFPPKADAVADVSLFEAPIYELGGEGALLYTQADVEAFVDMLMARGVPKGTILLPQGWNSPNSPTAFDKEAYPDPKGLIEELHGRGMKVMLTITPYVMAAGRAYQQSRKDGTLLCDTSGEPIVFISRLGHTACTDLRITGPERLNQALKELQTEYNIDGFYFDCLDAAQLLADNNQQLGEFLSVWHSVCEGLDMTIYTSPTTRPLCLSAGSLSTSRQQSWQSLSSAVEAAVDGSVLGFVRTCLAADLDYMPLEGGLTDQELILRSAQMALSLPVAIVPYALWGLDNSKAVDDLLAWRKEISPYIASIAQQGVSTAEPIIRHLEYEFPRTGFANCHDEFMIGDRYLVAPATTSSARRMVRLPKGRWIAPDGSTIRGPKVMDVDVSGGRMAVYKVK